MDDLAKTLAGFDVYERLLRLPDDALLTNSETAIFLRCSTGTIENMRRDGTGPAYSQMGGKGAAGSNQRCLYEKADLLAWVRANKVASTREAAVRKGQLFASVFDLARTEAFWVDDEQRVVGMVEAAPIGIVVGRLGRMDIAWLPVIDACAGEWSDLAEHRRFADGVRSALGKEIQRVDAGIETTDIAASSRD